jgi:hypothetical protein
VVGLVPDEGPSQRCERFLSGRQLFLLGNNQEIVGSDRRFVGQGRKLDRYPLTAAIGIIEQRPGGGIIEEIVVFIGGKAVAAGPEIVRENCSVNGDLTPLSRTTFRPRRLSSVTVKDGDGTSFVTIQGKPRGRPNTGR